MDDHPTNGVASEAVGMRDIIMGDDEANKQVEYTAVELKKCITLLHN
jgi:hypothetical protein